MPLFVSDACGDTWSTPCTFSPCTLFQGGKGHLKSKSLAFLNQNPWGDPASIFLERGTLPRPRGALLVGAWTKLDSLGQIWNGFLKASIGPLVTETCQIMCQECLVPSPWRVAVFNEKTQLWKLRHSLYLSIFIKTGTKPQETQTPPVIDASPFPCVYLIYMPWKLIYKDIAHGSICRATVPSLLVLQDAKQWEERRGGGKLNKTFKNKILAGTSTAQITKRIGILFC